MTGTADSQIYHNMLTGRGVDTEGAAYQTGRFGGSLLFPTGAAGRGVRVTGRAVTSLTEKVATKLADDAANAARSTAAARVAQGGRVPRATSAAVDPVTGKVTTGFSGERLTPPASLNSRLPDPPVEMRWPVNNCAEVAACVRQLDGVTDPFEQAAILDRLVFYTVHTKTGEYFPPCGNCATWVPGQ